MNKYKILINGELIDSDKTLIINNPTTNTPAGEVPIFNSNWIVDTATNSAKASFKEWSMLDWTLRAQYLEKFRDLMLQKKDELADILVSEIAKTKKESLIEVERSAEYITDTISIYKKIKNNPVIIDEKIHNIKGKKGKFFREPLGVVLAISPFNYPVNLLISKLVPALITGNTVVYKSATQGSLVGARISELFYEANFPKGVVNCVTGTGKEIGDLLVTNKNIDMISFTGSTNVGQRIAEITSKIPLVLELGGKDPAIVLDDADLELASSEIVKGGLSYNGQRCTAIKRVLVTPKVHNELSNLIVDKVKKLTVGKPQENTNITPVISSRSADYIMGLVEDAIKDDANPLTTIKREDNLIYPIVLDNVSPNSRIAWEEPFGPVLPIIECKNIEECIELANKSEYGLQASIFTRNIDLAETIAHQIEAGSVNINRSSSRGPDIFPFLGLKNSGFGVQGLEEAILSMTKIKGIVYNN